MSTNCPCAAVGSQSRRVVNPIARAECGNRSASARIAPSAISAEACIRLVQPIWSVRMK